VELDVEAAGRAIVEAIPERVRERYRRRAMQAPTNYRAAVFLKCLQCSEWEYKEAQRCRQVLCPLWEYRAKLFRPYRGKAKLRVVK
jgi:hypothetical protein